MKILLFLFLCSTVFGIPGNSTEWFRYPAISPDGQKVVFTYKGNLFLVSSQGGTASQLTFHGAHDFHPVWSHDGSKIAFSSKRYGNFDVYCIDVKGGQSKRLTYHSTNETPYTFSADNKEILFGAARMDTAAHRQFPIRTFTELYSVPVNGGKVDQVWTIPSEAVEIGRNGDIYVYHDVKGRENFWRKHHKSSVTRDLWIYDRKTDTHRQLTDDVNENRNPVLASDQKTVYFLREEEGSFNIFKSNLASIETKVKVTEFNTHPIRFLSISDNDKICFGYNGSIYTMDKEKHPKKLMVNVKSGIVKNRESVIPIVGNVSEMAISPNGKEIAFIARGDVFVSSVKGKYTKRITKTANRERFLSFTPDGTGVVYASERNGKWGIYKTEKIDKKERYFFIATRLKESVILVNGNDNYQPKFSPDGKELAYIENRRALKVLNFKSKSSRVILGDDILFYMRDGDQYFSWSPDSRWFFVQIRPEMANSEILLVNANDPSKKTNLTQSGYIDYMPKWVNGGKQMLWFSNRHGLRSYANSGAKQMDIYTLFFTKSDWERAKLSKDDFSLLKEESDLKKKKNSDKKKSGKKKIEKSKTKPIKIDWKGLEDRVRRLSIHSAYMADAVLSKDAETLYYLARFEKGYDLWQTKLRTKETKLLIRLGIEYGTLYWDKNHKSLYLLSRGNIHKIDLSKKRKKRIHINSELVLDQKAERTEMFNHVWHRTKAMFYEPGFHGADWVALRKNYQSKLDHIGNGYEFAELLSEMLGELNVSHCNARYRYTPNSADRTSAVGIIPDRKYLGEGIRVAEIIAESPLDRSDVDIRSGMILTHINGNKITNKIDHASYFNRLTGKFTALTFVDKKSKKVLNITVKPISLDAQNYLMYKRWVKQNEADVIKMSNGRLGYVHVPGMSDGTYRVVYEKAMGKFFNSDGLIVDTRFNGGGDLVGDITMFLTGEKFLTYGIKNRDLGQEPNYRWTKPNVAMVNESNYSDGHCFACAYKDLKIGPMIGMPVPGTCSFAGWETLQDGRTRWGTVPVSAKNKAGEWLENNQTVPDYIIKNMPGKVDKGIDQQLEKAVSVLLDLIDKNK